MLKPTVIVAAGAVAVVFVHAACGGSPKPAAEDPTAEDVGVKAADAPERSDAEPSDAEPSGAEPRDAEPSGAEPRDAEPSGAEPRDAEPSSAEPSDAEPSSAEPSSAEPSLLDERPDWITAAIPASAQCREVDGRLICVGVSFYRRERDAARLEATRAAKEGLADAIALKIDGAAFEDIRERYAGVRRDALGALEAARGDRGQIDEIVGKVRQRRAAVAEVLDATGGAAVPAAPTDWYWEQYEAVDGAEHDYEYLVFVRLDLSQDAIRRLEERYGAPVSAAGSSVLTFFPSLAWRYPGVESGVIVVEAGGPLAGAGVVAGDIVSAVEGERIRDARALAEALKATGEPLRVTAWRPDGTRR